MVTITLGKLKDKGESLAKFLQEKLKNEAKIEGDSVVIQGNSEQSVSKKSVKVYLKRFLYQEGVREKYRVRVAGDKIELTEVKIKEG